MGKELEKDNLNGFITYEELISQIDLGEKRVKDRAKLWRFYVEQAKGIGVVSCSRRMAIAETAIRAIGVVKKGKRPQEFSGPSITRFAGEIGVDRRTLGDWIKAKTKVFDYLNDEDKFNFQVSTAISAVEKSKNYDPAEIVALYKGYLGNPWKRRQRKSVLEYLRASQRTLTKGDLKQYSPADLEKLMELAKKIVARLAELKLVHEIGKKSGAGAQRAPKTKSGARHAAGMAG